MNTHPPPGASTARIGPFELDWHPQRVVFGAGRVNDVPAELDRGGIGSVLLVGTRSAKPAVQRLAELLGPRVAARVDEVVQHVPITDVALATEAATRTSAGGILTVGGGSATGLGKAVAVRTGLPLLAVPTTYSGSEATSVYGITDVHKRTARDPRALPRVVVYDPELTISMPRRLTATSGLNAVAHCVEAMYTRGAHPLGDLVATDGLRRLAGALPVVSRAPGDLAARGEALYGAYLAGWSMATTGTALHHVLCHVIGGSYRVDHGELHAVLLPYVVAYNQPAAPEALGRVAGVLGTAPAAVGLRDLAERLGAPRDLASAGLPATALDDVVARALDSVGDRNPRHPDATSLRRMLDDAHAGRPPGDY